MRVSAVRVVLGEAIQAMETISELCICIWTKTSFFCYAVVGILSSWAKERVACMDGRSIRGRPSQWSDDTRDPFINCTFPAASLSNPTSIKICSFKPFERFESPRKWLYCSDVLNDSGSVSEIFRFVRAIRWEFSSKRVYLWSKNITSNYSLAYADHSAFFRLEYNPRPSRLTTFLLVEAHD